MSSLLNELHSLHNEYINNKDSQAMKDRYNKVKQKTQAKLREMKHKWWCDRTKELQSAADTKNAKKFFSELKTVYGPSSKGTSPLLTLMDALCLKNQPSLQRDGHSTSTRYLTASQRYLKMLLLKYRKGQS